MDDLHDYIIRILTIIPAIFLVLSLHELGHYLMARLYGVHARDFSIGYGKALYKRRLRNETTFTLRLFPLGAYVGLDGEAYKALSSYKTIAVILGGPLFNFLTVFPLFFIFFATAGQPSTPPVFAGIEIGGVADKAGLETNDRFLTVNGKPVVRYEDILKITREPAPQPLEFTIQRGNEIHQATVIPEIVDYIDLKGLKKKHGRLGVIVRHAPFDLVSIASVNGVAIANKDKDAARQALLSVTDQYATIGFKSTDGTIRPYRAWVDGLLNKDLQTPKAEHFDHFFIGTLGSHFYNPLPVRVAFEAAAIQSGELFAAITTIPLQLFPMDKEKFKPDETARDKPVLNWIYKFIFFTALISIVVGFVNLIPLPHFDGGQLLLLVAAKINPALSAKKYQAILIVTALLTLYAGVALANYKNFKTYTHHKFCVAPAWEKDKKCD